jgi:hypothetical protein
VLASGGDVESTESAQLDNDGRMILRAQFGGKDYVQKLPLTSGGSGIRTHGGLHLTAFQEPRICPLCHPSQPRSG